MKVVDWVETGNERDEVWRTVHEVREVFTKISWDALRAFS